jgi:hypothetical protein
MSITLARCLEEKLHVVSGEQPIMSIRSVSSPPSPVHLLDPGDEVMGVKGDFCVIH